MAFKKYDESGKFQDVNTGEIFTAKRITNASYTHWKNRGEKDRWSKFRKTNSVEDGGSMFINPNTKTVGNFVLLNGNKSVLSPKTINTSKTTSKTNTMRKMNLNMGPVSGNSFKLTIMGGVAVAIDGGYSSYDKETGELTDVTGFTMDFDGAFYNMPAIEVEAGDLISTKHGYGYVIKQKEGSVKVMLLDGEVKEIVSTRSPFGFEFYTKVVSIFDMAGGSNGGGMFGDMNPMMLMMMSGNGNGSGSGSGNPFGGDMMSMMMMSQMMGGESGGLGSLFGGKGKSKGKSKS